MSKFVKKDSKGITIDADALRYHNELNPLDPTSIKNNPIMDRNRINALRRFIQGDAKKLNPKIKAISEAQGELNKVMEHNQKLIEKGLNPRNEKDAKHFKIFDPNKISILLGLFSGR